MVFSDANFWLQDVVSHLWARPSARSSKSWRWRRCCRNHSSVPSKPVGLARRDGVAGLVDRPFQPDNIIVTIVTSFFENTETTLLDIFHWWPPRYYLDKNDARCDHCDHWRISWSKYCKWLKVFKPLKRTDLVANWMIPKGFSWQRRGFPARALGMFLLTLENPETWRINETCSAVSIALGLAGS